MMNETTAFLELQKIIDDPTVSSERVSTLTQIRDVLKQNYTANMRMETELNTIALGRSINVADAIRITNAVYIKEEDLFLIPSTQKKLNQQDVYSLAVSLISK